MTTAGSRLNLLTLIDQVMSFIPSVCKSHLSISLFLWFPSSRLSYWKQAQQRRWPLRIGNIHWMNFRGEESPDSRASKLCPSHSTTGLVLKNTQGQRENRDAMRVFFVYFLIYLFFLRKKQPREKKSQRMKGERLSIYRLQLSFRSRSKLKNEATSLLAVADSLPGTHRKMMNPAATAAVQCHKADHGATRCLVFLAGLDGAEPPALLPAAEGSLSPWRPFSFTRGDEVVQGKGGGQGQELLEIWSPSKKKKKRKKKWHSNNPKTLAWTCMRKRPQASARLHIASGAWQRLPEHMSHANAAHGGNLFTTLWHARAIIIFFLCLCRAKTNRSSKILSTEPNITHANLDR